MGNDIIVKRIETFYHSETYLIINNKINLPITSLLCKYFELDSTSGIGLLFNQIRSNSPPNSRAGSPPKPKKASKRGFPAGRLFGMDNFSQLEVSSKIYHPDINILILSLPELETLQVNEYKIMTFRSNLEIYIKSLVVYNLSSKPLPINYTDSLFYLGKDAIFLESEEIVETAITRVPINLLLIDKNHYTFSQVIIDNPDLDGWIAFSQTGYELWLKDINLCTNFNTFDSTEKKTFLLQEDMNKIKDFNVATWKIKFENGSFFY